MSDLERDSESDNDFEEVKPPLTGLPSLLSPEVEVSSEIAPHFRALVETLTDSDSDDKFAVSSAARKTAAKNGIPAIAKQPSPDIVENENTYFKNSYYGESGDSPAQEKPKSRKKHKDTNDDTGSAKKKAKKDEESSKTLYSNKAQSMMEKMGYEPGKGLGKNKQGRVAPVPESTQKGRRGLGLVLKEADRELIKYDPSKEVYDVLEAVEWLIRDGDKDIEFTHELLNDWKERGKKKMKLDDETHFCNAEILKHVLICKTAFDMISPEDMRKARTRCNPYELIKNGIFLNRAAMKMANMDSVFEYMFTRPVDENGDPLVKHDQLLYFADVCAGPGGFSEYVLWRKKWGAKGFGFTLKGENDFKLDQFYAGPCESFEPYYGDPNGKQDGDVYNPDNIRSFKRHVLENTDMEGVHFMMADGGFSVAGKENLQEILSKRLYLCQCLVALLIVRPRGHFVCKLFDLFTPFSVGIIYLMYHCFKQISIHKPNTSRPANSERYIICKWRKDNVDIIADYMMHINIMLEADGEINDNDILKLVPLGQMKSDKQFYEYMCSSNNRLGERQINSLAKILEYSEDETLTEIETQNRLKAECMDLWGVPKDARKVPNDDDPANIFKKLVNNSTDFLDILPASMAQVKNIDNLIHSVYDWHAVFSGVNVGQMTVVEDEATFYLGTHKKCYKYHRKMKKWLAVKPKLDAELNLSPDTLLYGEIVPEIRGQRWAQTKIEVFHIIDGHTLGGTNISDLHFEERIQRCKLFAKSLSKPSLFKCMQIRMKMVYDLDSIDEEAFNRMEIICMKNSQRRMATSVDPILSDHYFIPTGLIFIKSTRDPYQRSYSRSNKAKYYGAKGCPATYECPPLAIASFRFSIRCQHTWYPSGEEENEDAPFNKKKFIRQLTEFVQRKRINTS